MKAFVIILFVVTAMLSSCGESDKPQAGLATNKDSAGIAEDTASFKPDTILNLSNRGMESLPEDIEAYGNARAIDLSGNPGLNLTEVFVALAKLPKLHTLYLKNNSIAALPPDIGYMITLKNLDLTANELKTLPQEINMLQGLEVLKLSFNQIDAFPVVLTRLKMLKTLEMSDNYLKSLPDSIGFMGNLNKLILSKNEISSIPVNIGNLKKLEFFDLSKNLLSKLPNSIGNLVNLNYLDLSNNELDFLPATFERFNNRPLQLYLDKNLFEPKTVENIRKMLPNSAISIGE